MKCPDCGNEHLDRESVDIGVGTLEGPYSCPVCGWCEVPLGVDEWLEGYLDEVL